VGVDVRVGVDYQFANGMSVVGGYQMQLWRDVTVGISDDTNIGGNTGTSDLLLHGAFIGVEFTF
jgi:hypothetical protein